MGYVAQVIASITGSSRRRAEAAERALAEAGLIQKPKPVKKEKLLPPVEEKVVDVVEVVKEEKEEGKE